MTSQYKTHKKRNIQIRHMKQRFLIQNNDCAAGEKLAVWVCMLILNAAHESDPCGIARVVLEDVCLTYPVSKADLKQNCNQTSTQEDQDQEADDPPQRCIQPTSKEEDSRRIRRSTNGGDGWRPIEEQERSGDSRRRRFETRLRDIGRGHTGILPMTRSSKRESLFNLSGP